MNQEKLHDILSYILVSTGVAGATTMDLWQHIDLILAIIVKCISALSFGCFILINQDKIKEGWRKMIEKFYWKVKSKEEVEEPEK